MKYQKMKSKFTLFLWLVYVCLSVPMLLHADVVLNKHKPVDVNPLMWSKLTAVIEEAKLLPSPIGYRR
jgi:hypothetical protein